MHQYWRLTSTQTIFITFNPDIIHILLFHLTLTSFTSFHHNVPVHQPHQFISFNPNDINHTFSYFNPKYSYIWLTLTTPFYLIKPCHYSRILNHHNYNSFNPAAGRAAQSDLSTLENKLQQHWQQQQQQTQHSQQ